MHIHTIRMRAVEIAGERRKRALQIWRAARGVIPRIANLSIHQMPVPRLALRVKSQRIAIAIRLAVERRSEEHTSELQSRFDLVCRLLLEKKKMRPPNIAIKRRPSGTCCFSAP